MHYGLIGNGTAIGIVSSNGSIEWLCCPDADMPSHFSTLIDDRSGGRFSIRPAGKFESTQQYLGDNQRSAVLQTTFNTPTGRGRLIDWMPWKQAPVVRRLVETLEGSIVWDLFCLPKFQYGQIAVTPQRVSEGVCFRASGLSDLAHLSSTEELRLDSMLGAAIARFDLKPGESRQFSWAWGRAAVRAETLLKMQFEDTLNDWDLWFQQCELASKQDSRNLSPGWQAVQIRSEVALRLLTHSGTGAMLESAALSSAGDHRYCWMRSCPDFLMAWIQTGHIQEAQDLWSWISDRIISNGPADFHSAYTLDGAWPPDERELHGLRGMSGGRNVRLGNAASWQTAPDALAAALMCCHVAHQAFGISLTSPLWPRIQEFALLSSQLWRRPDHGIWDSRLRPEHYLATKVATWKALQSAQELFSQSGKETPLRWQQESQKLHDTVIREGFNPGRQAYTQAFGELELDSSALLVGLWGLQDWSSPELLSTLILLENELRDGFLLRRSRSLHASPDYEGGHLVSTFWWLNALVEVGRVREAYEILSEICNFSTPHGFLPEAMDPSTGAPIGSFPSARSHSLFLRTSRTIQKAMQKASAQKQAA